MIGVVLQAHAWHYCIVMRTQHTRTYHYGHMYTFSRTCFLNRAILVSWARKLLRIILLWACFKFYGHFFSRSSYRGISCLKTMQSLGPFQHLTEHMDANAPFIVMAESTASHQSAIGLLGGEGTARPPSSPRLPTPLQPHIMRHT